MKKTIAYSVGAWEKGAKNKPEDVTVVQILLTAAAKELENNSYDPKGIDGKISKTSAVSNTVKAIRAFQSSYSSYPDGLVEPGKNTITKLAASVNGQPGPVPGNIPESPLKNVGDYFFPFSYVPHSNYRTGGKRFGASRSSGTRKHAGCDLIAPEGTKVFAVHDGKITRGPYFFYRGTYAIEVDHGSFVARYCEIKKVAKGLSVGSEVTAGQLIAYVGKMYYSSMLHFELYSGDASGSLTQTNNPPYKRRSDLRDPTPYLDIWETNLPVDSA